MQVELSGCNFSFSARSDLPNRSETVETILDEPSTILGTISEPWDSQNGDFRDRDFGPFCACRDWKRCWMDHLPGEHTSQKFFLGSLVPRPPPKKFVGSALACTHLNSCAKQPHKRYEISLLSSTPVCVHQSGESAFGAIMWGSRGREFSGKFLGFSRCPFQICPY